MDHPTPADPALPHLATLLDGAAMAPHLAAVCSGMGPVDAELIRHKPGRRAVIRYAGGATVLFGKTFASERGARVHRTAEAVFALARRGELPFRVAEPVAWLPDLRLCLLRELSGEPVDALLLAGATVLARRIARELAALHASALVLDREHLLADELAPLPGRVANLSQRAPDLATPAVACLARVQHALLDGGHRWRRRPIHRDCYHEQWLLGPDGLALLDFDDAKLGEPAVDVANVVAHFRLLALQHGHQAAALGPVVDAFLDAAHTADPDLAPDLVRLLEAATLLRLADIHQPRANGDAIATALIALCEERLETSA